MATRSVVRATAMVFILLLLMGVPIQGGPTMGAICSSGCATLACYGAAGSVFGTVTAGVGTAPAILACNAAFGTCMAKCAVVTALPTP